MGVCLAPCAQKPSMQSTPRTGHVCTRTVSHLECSAGRDGRIRNVNQQSGEGIMLSLHGPVSNVQHLQCPMSWGAGPPGGGSATAPDDADALLTSLYLQLCNWTHF